MLLAGTIPTPFERGYRDSLPDGVMEYLVMLRDVLAVIVCLKRPGYDKHIVIG